MAKFELLAPAFSPESLDAAIGEGADAVYLSLKDFIGGRADQGFSYSQFENALRSLRRLGRKVYVALETVFEQREADRVYQLLKYLAALGPSGIYADDLGIAAMARENFPSLKLFAGSRINIASSRGANQLSRCGFSRTTLARELSIEEIAEIRANTNIELEIFVHGSICISISGTCLFSSFLGGKSDNRGMCPQACRRSYAAGDFEGGYYFSPADLQLIEKIPTLAKTGVNSFKIDSRVKSSEHIGTVVSAYRLVIDNLDSEGEILRSAVKEALNILKNDFSRSKTEYFFNGHKEQGEVDWLDPKQDGGTGILLGKLLRTQKRVGENFGLLSPAIAIPSLGDSVRFQRFDDSARITRKLTFAEKSADGLWISIPEGFSRGDKIYLIQTRAMSKRYPQLVDKAKESGRSPGRDNAPMPQKLHSPPKALSTGRAKTKGRGDSSFPGGFYAAVSRVEDLYILQSFRPEKAILPLSQNLVSSLCREQSLPFSPKDIILSLDPFLPQEKDSEITESVSILTERGYNNYIVNNIGHFSMFREIKSRQGNSGSGKTALIAGPWLYSFNFWACNFLLGIGAEFCVSPLENNRQNLEKTFPPGNYLRNSVFVTVLSRPSLFRMRADLAGIYGFEEFSGRDENFRLASIPGGSVVYPEQYFSIVDKIPFLREAGFSRFIFDLSSCPLKKAEYRDLMESVERNAPLPGTSRFNWKNGFFREPETSRKHLQN